MINESGVMNSKWMKVNLTITNYNDQEETWTLEWV